MPNHLHGIVIISAKILDGYLPLMHVGARDHARLRAPESEIPEKSETNLNLKSPPKIGFKDNEFGPQSRNLASIVRGYKGAVKKFATVSAIEFNWQNRYHDHIIRSRRSFSIISNYIEKNPVHWETDGLTKARAGHKNQKHAARKGYH
jgi:putative transposase